MRAVLAVFLAGIVSIGSSPPEPSPSTASSKYRLARTDISGIQPRQWVWVISSPNGYAAVVAPSHLERHIALVVPEGTTLEWDPGCSIIGGEPMASAAEVEAFAAFCRQRGINFVRVPSG